MFNKKALKIAALKVDLSFSDLAVKLGVSVPTFYGKVKRDGDFKRDEIALLGEALQLTDGELQRIFFD